MIDLVHKALKLILIMALYSVQTAIAQQSDGSYNTDTKGGCKVWCKYPGDVVSWTGDCKYGFAEGFGTVTWFENGKEAEKFVGYMIHGRPHGHGTLTFPDKRFLTGNFINGEFLDLDEAYLELLERNAISLIDKPNIYVSDGTSEDLFYISVVPKNKPIGCLVLMPAAWETVEHAISSTKSLCQAAVEKNIAVIYPSVNQHIVLNSENLAFLNAVISDATKKIKISKKKFVLGGLSMGGVLAVSYAQLAVKDPTKTVLLPKAVFNVDGPADLENLYKCWKLNLENPRNNNNPEGHYVIGVLEKQAGGSPETAHEGYSKYSIYTRSEKDGGNAKYLDNLPVRIYNDVDVNWWLSNRSQDLYCMNALDQTAMINFLIGLGNNKAEFINAYQKGYRIEGNRHPHSWSIVDPNECVSWILKCLQD